MAVRSILVWPDPVLHEVSKPVDDPASPEFRALVEDLLDTMYASGGVGLAAIQIGVPLRVFVMDVDYSKVGDRVFVNPRVVKTEGDPSLTNEGCLSMPGIIEQVMRYPTVVVDGGAFVKTVTGLEAQCVQHEVEHLDGVVMADKFSKERQELMRLTLKHRKEGQ